VSASGLLRPDNVIFYHSLDTYDEYTLNQTWSGSTGFTDGKIGNGTSAITADSFSFGPEYNTGEGNTYPKSILGLDSSHVLAIGRVKSYTVTVSGSTLTYGTGGAGGGNDNVVNKPLLMSWDGTDGKAVMFSRLRGSTALLTLADGGDTITRTHQYFTGFDSSTGGCVAKLDDTHFIASASGATDGSHAAICTITNGSFNIGTKYNFPSGLLPDAAVGMGNSGVLFICSSGATTATNAFAMMATASGDNITFHDPIKFSESYRRQDFPAEDYGHAVNLDDSRALVLWCDTTGRGLSKIFSVSGENITASGATTVFEESGASADLQKLNAELMEDDVVAINYYHKELDQPLSDYASHARKCTIDNLTPEFGNKSQVSTDRAEGIGVISLSQCVCGLGPYEQVTKLGTLDQEASISGISGYPSASGNDRISCCMWTQKPSDQNTTFTTSRDYTIQMTSGSISLGPDGAVWDDSGITSIMSTLNDGDDHFLILDFENTGGTNWNLSTSIDGATWVEHSGQASGSRDTSPLELSPGIGISSGVAGQWYDELVLWGGDKSTFSRFADEEIEKVYNLANKFNISMDNYGIDSFDSSDSIDLFVKAPEISTDNTDLFIKATDTVSSSADLRLYYPSFHLDDIAMFISGPVELSGSLPLYVDGVQVNASCDLFIDGSILHSGILDLVTDGDYIVYDSTNLFITGFEESTTVARSFDWLLKTTDYNPQIIGTLENSNTVNIQIWDVTDGENTLVSIASSGCYQIGNTGRWGWSTSNLPNFVGNPKHYYYIMTSDLETTFDGQFIFDVPENAKWIHPDNRSSYIR